jgi:hypothetical protein
MLLGTIGSVLETAGYNMPFSRYGKLYITDSLSQLLLDTICLVLCMYIDYMGAAEFSLPCSMCCIVQYA